MLLPTAIETVETMSSSQLAEMLNYEKKEINRKIRDIFQAKIDGGVISPSLDARGYVKEYYLPELESKMFVAKHDMDYLELITQYWIDRNKPKQMTTMEMVAQSAMAMVEHERRLAAIELAAQEQVAKVENIEHRLDNRGCDAGYMMVTDAHRAFGTCVSLETFKLVLSAYDVTSKPLVSEYGSLTKQVSIESVQEIMEDFHANVEHLKGEWHTHPLLGMRNFKYTV